MYIFLCWSFWYIKLMVPIWFHLNPRNFNPRNFQFLASFSFKAIFPLSPSVTKVSHDRKFYCASFGLWEKFVGRYPPTSTPTQKFKNEFSIFSSQEIDSSLVSLEMIFEAPHSELFRFKIQSLSSKIEKIPKFSLLIKAYWR